MSSQIAKRLIRNRSYVCAECSRRIACQTPSRRAFQTIARVNQKEDNLLELLERRGYVNQLAGDRDAFKRLLKTKRLGFYAGIDPTAPSLHLGHLLPLMVLFWVSLHGHVAVSLVGGGTARVGDPSGRLSSRAETQEGVQKSNCESLFGQVKGLWQSAEKYAQRHGYKDTQMGNHKLLNNEDWLGKLNILDFLKTLGNGMRLGTMMGRDTVRNKMEKGDGMSFSEFTYPLLQGWDWWHMYRKLGVQVQIGGSDQYGNIVAGMDAVKYIAQNSTDSAESSQGHDSDIRLKEESTPMGLTVPLLTTSSGEKFGKSAGNAVWLDRTMTSSFDMYGFLLRSSDTDVERYLKLFTFLPTLEIDSLMAAHSIDPGKRKAQHLLASEVLELVHGPEEATKTHAEHQAMRNPSFTTLWDRTTNLDESTNTSEQQQRIFLSKSQVQNIPLYRILHKAGLAATKSEAARLVSKGGVYVANTTLEGNDDSSSPGALSFIQLKDPQATDMEQLLQNGLLILRLGKWKARVIQVVEDDALERTKQEPDPS